MCVVVCFITVTSALQTVSQFFTMMSKHRLGMPRPPSCLTFTLILTLTWTMTLPRSCHAFFFNYGNAGGGGGNNMYGMGGWQQQQPQQQQQQELNKEDIQLLKDRVAGLETLLQDQLHRLKVAEEVVTDLGRQQCAAGEAIVHNCTGSQICVTSPDLGTLPMTASQELTIPFTTAFLVPPVLEMTATTSEGGGSCTMIHTQHISHLHFTLTYPTTPASCPLPFLLRWYACPAAIFQADQGLPLPVEPAAEGEPAGSGGAGAEPEPARTRVPPAPPTAKAPGPFPAPRPTLAGGWGGRGDWSREDEDDDK